MLTTDVGWGWHLWPGGDRGPLRVLLVVREDFSPLPLQRAMRRVGIWLSGGAHDGGDGVPQLRRRWEVGGDLKPRVGAQQREDWAAPQSLLRQREQLRVPFQDFNARPAHLFHYVRPV